MMTTKHEVIKTAIVTVRVLWSSEVFGSWHRSDKNNNILHAAIIIYQTNVKKVIIQIMLYGIRLVS